VVASGVVCVLIAAVSAVWLPGPFRPVPGTPEVVSLSGSFTDGLLVLSLPDGSVSISGEGTRESRPPDGCGIVLVEGEP
jgi:hypothetical protein